jgi:hypothetical protein
VEHGYRVLATVVSIVTVSVATLGVLAPRAFIPERTTEMILLAAILGVLIILADFFEIDAPLSSVRVTVSVSAALCFAAAITLGPLVGALVAGTSALLVETVQRREVIKTVLNVSNYITATFVAGFVYYWLADTSLSPVGSIDNVLATILAASIYTIIDSGTIALVLSQVVGTSPFELWRANFRSALFEHISLPTMGIMIPILAQESLFALVIVIIPLLGPYLAFRSYRQIHEETRSTLRVLADMLDRRDAYTAEHSLRVSELVSRMLDHYPDVSFEESEIILTAARIHDLGKVTTSDATLLKPGRLSAEEIAEMQRHAADGAEILGNIAIFREASFIIRHHHERWDGKGYPDGLSGHQIPIGSRLIAVADTYDAMTTDRPYRKALPHHVAVQEIRRQAGAQFEPASAEAFLRATNECESLAGAPVRQEVRPSD